MLRYLDIFAPQDPGDNVRWSGKPLVPDEVAELNALLEAMPAAIKLASKLLHEMPTDSPVYIAADAEVARIISRINALLNG